MSPENYTPWERDTWALACTFYELISERPLFFHTIEYQAYIPITKFNENILRYMLGEGEIDNANVTNVTADMNITKNKFVKGLNTLFPG